MLINNNLCSSSKSDFDEIMNDWPNQRKEEVNCTFICSRRNIGEESLSYLFEESNPFSSSLFKLFRYFSALRSLGVELWLILKCFSVDLVIIFDTYKVNYLS